MLSETFEFPIKGIGMYIRDNLDTFTQAIDCLRHYKQQLEQDLSKLIDRSDSTNEVDDNNIVVQVNPNSPASKKKQNDEFTLAMQIYEKEHCELLEIIDIREAERMAEEAELDRELDEIARHDQAVQNNVNVDTGHLVDHKHTDENLTILNLLTREADYQLEIINKYIDSLQIFVSSVTEAIETQRTSFLTQFHDDIKAMLLEKYPTYGDCIEVDIGGKKILINVEYAAAELTKEIQNEFGSDVLFDRDNFQYKLQTAFTNIIIQHPESYEILQDESAHDHIRKVSAEVASSVVTTQADVCSIALNADRLKCHELQWAQDILAVTHSTRAELQNLCRAPEMNLSQSANQERVKALSESVKECKAHVAEIKQVCDTSQASRTLTAIDASQEFMMRRARNRLAKQTPAPADPTIQVKLK